MISRLWQLAPFSAAAMGGTTVACRILSNGKDDTLDLTYEIGGNTDTLVLPAVKDVPELRDRLYESTCLEFFFQARSHGQKGYFELNLSPSGDYACYDFVDYRRRDSSYAAGPKMPWPRPPKLLAHSLTQSLATWTFRLAISPSTLVRAAPAVILQRIVARSTGPGEIEYWALRHGLDKPDFHRLALWDAL